MLKKSDGVLDWTQDAMSVANRAHGVDPWPGASTTMPDGSLLKLFIAQSVADHGELGTVLGFDMRGVVIGCGSGAVAFREVQAAGKRRMLAQEFARGGALMVGAKLGGPGRA
jgi:methionyl-tRNA formyltransferase